MSTIRRFVLTEGMLLLLILLAGATATATEARYRLQRRASDTARVARPVLSVVPLTDPAELDWLMPGTAIDFEFTVDNASESEGISEVGLDYRLSVEYAAEDVPQLSVSLDWLDAAGTAHACQADEDGAYSAPVPFGAAAASQRFRLQVGLPADASLPADPRTVDFQVSVTAWQCDAFAAD